MAQTSRSRKQDRRRVAGGQDYEVRYESKKTGRSKKRVRQAVKRVGNSRKKMSANSGSDRYARNNQIGRALKRALVGLP